MKDLDAVWFENYVCVYVYIYTLFNSKALNHFMTVCIVSASEIVCGVIKSS